VCFVIACFFRTLSHFIIQYHNYHAKKDRVMQQYSKKFRTLFAFGLLSLSFSSWAEAPKPELILALSQSVAKVHIKNANGQHGIGSGAVVAENHVATNCHVIANAQGIAVNKFGTSYAPIAMKADWHHDLCILVFDNLPLKPFVLADSKKLAYEQHLMALGFSGNAPRPIEFFGSVKALVPFEDSVLVQTNSGFKMGASGGALLDYQGNLVGLTTFKSPGRNGLSYSLPVDWITKLLGKTELSMPTEAKPPFWDATEENRPYFMRTVSHYQNEDWSQLKSIANQWTMAEQQNVEAWYYLGLAEEKLNQLDAAKKAYQRALALAPSHSNALYALGILAMHEKNEAEAKRIGALLESIDIDFAEDFYIKAGLKSAPTS
jgi:hypothetical protein